MLVARICLRLVLCTSSYLVLRIQGSFARHEGAGVVLDIPCSMLSPLPLYPNLNLQPRPNDPANARDLSATTAQDEDGKAGKTAVVSIKHAMSRVKAGGGGTGDGGTASISGASSGEPRVADGNRLKAALRASIESRTSSHDGNGELDDDDDDDEDLDSPRNRGRQYDDRWKMPGHAESVLASFVERLEHRGHAIDADDNGGGGGGSGRVVSGDKSAAAALEEARASRGAAVEVLGRSQRLQSERTAARNSPGRSERTAVAESGKKRRSGGGGGKSGSGAKNGTGTGAGAGTRSRGKGAKTSTSGRRGSAGKGRAAGAAGTNESGGGHRRPSAGGGAGGSAGTSAGSGAWSKFASSIQRAAEAIVGVAKEDGEEEQQHRTEVERTRNAVTAFLSSSRTQDQE